MVYVPGLEEQKSTLLLLGVFLQFFSAFTNFTFTLNIVEVHFCHPGINFSYYHDILTKKYR